MSNFRSAKIVEQRVYENPQRPEISPYDVVLPLTTTDAVVDPDTGGNITEKIRIISAQNILHNWDFRNPVNQRRIRGVFSDIGAYFIDRWVLISGTVGITTNGLSLNGTILQRLEHRAGNNVTASVEMSSGTATAVYNNNATTWATFVITSSGGTVRRAKLETGNISTLSADPPMDYGKELAVCHRYQFVTQSTAYYTATRITTNAIHFTVPLPVAMRDVPKVNGDYDVRTLSNVKLALPPGLTVEYNWMNTLSGLRLNATIYNHGRTDAQLSFNSAVLFDSNL